VSPDLSGSIADAPGSIDDAPTTVTELARQRAAARSRRDWPAADRLRADIEAAGWKVTDQGLDFHLEPAVTPDLVEDGRVHHGSSLSVPSLLDTPSTLAISIVLIAPDRPDELQRALASLRTDRPADSSLVVVANAPDAQMAEALGGLPSDGSDEVLWLGARLTPAAAANAGLRRSSGSVVVLLDEHARPTGDVVTPLTDALSDPAVAVAGASGLDSPDLRRWTPAGPGPVDALGWGTLAFRRDDLIERGPLEERFRSGRSLGPWWSLVLRDEGPDAAPRGALALSLPLGMIPSTDEDGPSLARAIKRDLYRLIDRFGHRYDLLRSPAPRGREASWPR